MRPISFYTFQSMSYVVDVYRQQMKPTRNIIDYLTYVSFFPQLVAGPIERGINLLPQILSSRVFNYHDAVDGLKLILWGFFKKLAVAENLATRVNEAYGAPQLFDGPHLAFATLCFAFQIYCDFSAYSDIAIGTGRLFGIKLMRNFAYPYFSQNVAEFWRRWHISLSTWFRDYVYVPLGGSHVSNHRIAFNLTLTFIISGLWHGAGWTFFVWGGLNGLAMLPSVLGRKRAQRLTQHDIPGGLGSIPQAGAVISMAATFAFICVTWVFFRAQNVADALTILERICSTPFLNTNSACFVTSSVSTTGAILLILGLVSAEWIQRKHMHPLVMAGWSRPIRWMVYSGLIWGTIYLTPPRPGSFIYFQF